MVGMVVGLRRVHHVLRRCGECALHGEHLLHLEHHLGHLVFEKLLHVVSLLLEFLFKEVVSLLEKIIKVTSLALLCIVQQCVHSRIDFLCGVCAIGVVQWLDLGSLQWWAVAIRRGVGSRRGYAAEAGGA